MEARIEIKGRNIHCRAGTASGGNFRIPMEDALLERMQGWASRYDGAVQTKDVGASHAVGAEIYAWLNGNGWADDWVSRTGKRSLEIAVGTKSTKWTEALLDLPWEILARGGEYLAADATQTFIVYRSIGINADDEPKAPEHSNMAVMWLAGAARSMMSMPPILRTDFMPSWRPIIPCPTLPEWRAARFCGSI